MIDPHVVWLQNQIVIRLVKASAVKAGFRRWDANPPDREGHVVVSAVDPPAPKDPNEVVAVVWNDRTAAHIAMNDPESVIASCRAELDIVDKHTNTGVLNMSTGDTEQICPTYRAPYPCATIRSLHAGYCTRDGWQRW